MIKYKCTITGKEYSEATIQANLSAAYRDAYTFAPKGPCCGCGHPGTESAHIIPKARCKQLQLTSLIWNPVNFFRSCRFCNVIAENISSKEIRELLNFQEILAVYKQYDNERYQILLQNE